MPDSSLSPGAAASLPGGSEDDSASAGAHTSGGRQRLPWELIVVIARGLHRIAYAELYQPLDEGLYEDCGDGAHDQEAAQTDALSQVFCPFLPSSSSASSAAAVAGTSTAAARTFNAREAKGTLLRLSAISANARSLLQPFIWSHITLKHPSDTVFLRSIAQHYANASSSSPSHATSLSLPPQYRRPSHIATSALAGTASRSRRPSPLAYISAITVYFPSDRYPNLQVDQPTLLELFSRYAMCSAAHSAPVAGTSRGRRRRVSSAGAAAAGGSAAAGGLRWLKWEADSLPHPALWAHLAARGLQQLEMDCKTFWQGHANWEKLVGPVSAHHNGSAQHARRPLRALKLTAYDANLLPKHLPALLLGTVQPDEESSDSSDAEHDRLSSASPSTSFVDERSTLKRTFRPSPEEVRERLEQSTLDEETLDHDGRLHRAPGYSITLGRRNRNVERNGSQTESHRHTPTADEPPSEATEDLSPESHFARLDLRPRSSLLHLSLSSSKTSVLHSLPLIHAGCFSSLLTLDVYPVTPEFPLALALASAGSTLRRLKLSLDINAALPNYDRLWQALTGRLRRLEVLELDPYPNERSAPSFTAFLQSCESLVWINGRRKEAMPPGFEMFDPDHRTGMFFY